MNNIYSSLSLSRESKNQTLTDNFFYCQPIFKIISQRTQQQSWANYWLQSNLVTNYKLLVRI